MAIKRFSSTFKTRNDVMDNITPNNVVQPHIAVPAGEWKPARYLPVQWTGEASKDAFVISSGKVVCLDATGRVADMCIKAACQQIKSGGNVATTSFSADISVGGLPGGASTHSIITYDSTDVAYGVYSIATGEAAAAGTLFIDQIAQGLLDQGLVNVSRDLGSTAPFSGGTATLEHTGSKTASDLLDDCLLVINAFFSEPVGVAAYDVFVWAGDTPDELVFTNYQKQHLIQFLTEVQLRLPVIAESSSSGATAISASSAYSSGPIFGQATGTELANADLVALKRYEDIGSNIQGLMLDPAGVSSNTDRTPFAEGSGFLTSEKNSIALVKRAGDFLIDAEAGIVLMYDSAADWTTGTIITTTMTDVSFFAKEGVSQQYRHAHISGPVRPGMKLSYDNQSNFCLMGKTDVDAHQLHTSNVNSLGRVMEIIREPRGLLDRVETAFKGSSFSASAKMPGTATKGFSDMITLSGEVVADELATIIVRF